MLRTRGALLRSLPRTGAGTVRAVLALASIVCAACSAQPAPADSGLSELERFAFVPAGGLSLPVGAGELWIEVREPLLVDMFEVTRGEWLAFRRGVAAISDSELEAHVGGWVEGTDDWPATFMSANEAADFARWRGMRLPSSAEWLYVAVGPQRRLYPWGSIDQRGIANTLDLDLGRPAPVGTFEGGRTHQHVYDLLGNVAEWTRDSGSDSGSGSETAARTSALGGSYRTYSRPIFDPRPSPGEGEIFARTLPPGSRADDLGLRCCVEARAWLTTHVGELPSGEAARARLVAIGRRWGPPAVPLLRELASGGAPPGIDALLEGARR